jgi:hypothetical protein
MTASETLCCYCGHTPGAGEELLQGKHGAICPGCIFALAARLAELGREGSTVPERLDAGADEADGLEPGADLVGNGEDGSAHDYASRMDLAAAYAELGKRQAAVRELLLALESALICGDHTAALTCVARARSIGDSPSLRDQICATLSRHAPSDS